MSLKDKNGEYFRIRIRGDHKKKYEELKLINKNMVNKVSEMVNKEHLENYQKIARAKRKLKKDK